MFKTPLELTKCVEQQIEPLFDNKKWNLNKQQNGWYTFSSLPFSIQIWTGNFGTNTCILHFGETGNISTAKTYQVCAFNNKTEFVSCIKNLIKSCQKGNEMTTNQEKDPFYVVGLKLAGGKRSIDLLEAGILKMAEGKIDKSLLTTPACQRCIRIGAGWIAFKIFGAIEGKHEALAHMKELMEHGLSVEVYQSADQLIGWFVPQIKILISGLFQDEEIKKLLPANCLDSQKINETIDQTVLELKKELVG